MRPLDSAGSVTMFDGIEMNVINMVLQIGVISNGVFPKPSLPQIIFTPRIASQCHTALHQRAGKTAFHKPQSRVVFRIVGWQGHHHVQVFGHDHDSINDKRVTFPCHAKRFAQGINMFNQQ